MAAQESETNIRVEVDMVQLNVAVTDSKGNYVTGLHPSDFVVDGGRHPAESLRPSERATSHATEYVGRWPDRRNSNHPAICE